MTPSRQHSDRPTRGRASAGTDRNAPRPGGPASRTPGRGPRASRVAAELGRLSAARAADLGRFSAARAAGVGRASAGPASKLRGRAGRVVEQVRRLV